MAEEFQAQPFTDQSMIGEEIQSLLQQKDSSQLVTEEKKLSQRVLEEQSNAEIEGALQFQNEEEQTAVKNKNGSNDNSPQKSELERVMKELEEDDNESQQLNDEEEDRSRTIEPHQEEADDAFIRQVTFVKQQSDFGIQRLFTTQKSLQSQYSTTSLQLEEKVFDFQTEIQALKTQKAAQESLATTLIKSSSKVHPVFEQISFNKKVEKVRMDQHAMTVTHINRSEDGEGLNFFEKVQMSETITHSNLTPIDKWEWIQLIKNPLKDKEEFISVQKVTRALKPLPLAKLEIVSEQSSKFLSEFEFDPLTTILSEIIRPDNLGNIIRQLTQEQIDSVKLPNTNSLNCYLRHGKPLEKFLPPYTYRAKCNGIAPEKQQQSSSFGGGKKKKKKSAFKNRPPFCLGGLSADYTTWDGTLFKSQEENFVLCEPCTKAIYVLQSLIGHPNASPYQFRRFKVKVQNKSKRFQQLFYRQIGPNNRYFDQQAFDSKTYEFLNNQPIGVFKKGSDEPLFIFLNKSKHQKKFIVDFNLQITDKLDGTLDIQCNSNVIDQDFEFEQSEFKKEVNQLCPNGHIQTKQFRAKLEQKDSVSQIDLHQTEVGSDLVCSTCQKEIDLSWTTDNKWWFCDEPLCDKRTECPQCKSRRFTTQRILNNSRKATYIKQNYQGKDSTQLQIQSREVNCEEAVLTFWNPHNVKLKQQNVPFKCFTVPNPVFLPTKDNISSLEFLVEGENQQVYYFTYYKDDLTLNQIDLGKINCQFPQEPQIKFQEEQQLLKLREQVLEIKREIEQRLEYCEQALNQNLETQRMILFKEESKENTEMSKLLTQLQESEISLRTEIKNLERKQQQQSEGEKEIEERENRLNEKFAIPLLRSQSISGQLKSLLLEQLGLTTSNVQPMWPSFHKNLLISKSVTSIFNQSTYIFNLDELSQPCLQIEDQGLFLGITSYDALDHQQIIVWNFDQNQNIQTTQFKKEIENSQIGNEKEEEIEEMEINIQKSQKNMSDKSFESNSDEEKHDNRIEIESFDLQNFKKQKQDIILSLQNNLIEKIKYQELQEGNQTVNQYQEFFQHLVKQFPFQTSTQYEGNDTVKITIVIKDYVAYIYINMNYQDDSSNANLFAYISQMNFIKMLYPRSFYPDHSQCSPDLIFTKIEKKETGRIIYGKQALTITSMKIKNGEDSNATMFHAFFPYDFDHTQKNAQYMKIVPCERERNQRKLGILYKSREGAYKLAFSNIVLDKQSAKKVVGKGKKGEPRKKPYKKVKARQVQTCDFTVNYPLLAYCPPNPLKNEIFINDLSTNDYQNHLVLPNMRVICFVETSLLKDSSAQDFNCIYFIGLDLNTQQTDLYTIKAKDRFFSQETEYKITGGKFKLKLDDWQNCRKAFYIRQDQNFVIIGQKHDFSLILDIESNLLTDEEKELNYNDFFLKQDKDEYDEAVIDNKFDYQYVDAVNGPDNQLYFCDRIDNKFSNIISVFTNFKESKDKLIQTKTIFNHSCLIRAFQLIIPDDFTRSEFNTQLAFLDEFLDYIILRKTNDVFSIHQKVNLRSPLSNIYGASLFNLPFEKWLLGPRSITTFKSKYKFHTVLNFTSGNSYVKQTPQIDQNFFGSRIKQIPWARRKIQLITGSNGDFFWTEKLVDTKFIDLFNIREQMTKPVTYSVHNAKVFAQIKDSQNWNVCCQISRFNMQTEYKLKDVQFRRKFNCHSFQHSCEMLYGSVQNINAFNLQLCIMIRDQPINFRKFSSVNKDFLKYMQNINYDIVFTNGGQLVLFERIIKPKSKEQEEVQKIVIKTDSQFVQDYCFEESLFQNKINIEYYGFEKSTQESQFQALMTQDYLVLKRGVHQVLFFNLPNLHQPDLNLDLTISKFSQVPTDKWFQDQDFSEGIRIDNINTSNIQQNKQQNLIQICTLSHAIIWNLEGKQDEIDSILNYQDLCKSNNYVRTSFQFYKFSQGSDENQKVSKLQKFQKNERAEQLKVYSNNNQTLISTPGAGEELGHLFQPFCELDIQEILTMQKNNGAGPLDIDSVLSDIYGSTMIQSFSGKSEFVRNVFQLFEPFSPNLASPCSLEIIEDPQIRRLFRNLKLLQPQCTFEKVQSTQIVQSQFNTVQFALQEENQNKFDPDTFDYLIKLLQLSSKANLADMFTNYQDFLHIYKNSYHVHDFLARCHTTPMSNQIQDLMWPSRQQQAIFISNSQWLSAKEIQSRIFKEFNSMNNYKRAVFPQFVRGLFQCKFEVNGKFKTSNIVSKYRNSEEDRLKPVCIKIFDSTWLMGNNLMALYNHLAQNQDRKMFDNVLIDALLMKHSYTIELSSLFFIFLIKLCLTLTYFYWVVPDFSENQGYNYFRFIIVALNCYQLYQEGRQLKQIGLAYFKDFWNNLQMSSCVMNLVIVICEMGKHLDFDQDNIPVYLTTLPSISSLLMFFQVFYWMSLYKQTSFYVTLITQALYDIGPFLVMVFVGICSFGNAILILDHNQETIYQYLQDNGLEIDEYDSLTQVKFGNKVTDSIMTEYLLSLGEFRQDDFEENPGRVLLWIYFLIATLLTQIILINSLISILGETYSRIADNRNMYAVIQRTRIYSDLLTHIKVVWFLKKRFLFVVQPTEIVQEEVWEGVFAGLKKKIKRLDDHLLKQNKKQQEMQLVHKQRFDECQQSIREVQKEQKEINTKIETQRDELMEKLNQILQIIKPSEEATSDNKTEERDEAADKNSEEDESDN